MLELLKAFLGYHHRRPLPSLLWLFGVALGVSMVSGIELASQAAIGSFTSATRALSGGATHELSSPGGSLEEGLYRELINRFPGLKAAPRVEGELTVGNNVFYPGRD